MLTPAGVERIKTIEKELRMALEAEGGTHSVYEAEEVRKRIAGSRCYKLYQKDASLESASDYDFTDMLYCLPDASAEKIRSAFDGLLGNAKAVDADDLAAFLEAARVRFRKLLEQ
jgi:hypothetical protein